MSRVGNIIFIIISVFGIVAHGQNWKSPPSTFMTPGKFNPDPPGQSDDLNEGCMTTTRFEKSGSTEADRACWKRCEDQCKVQGHAIRAAQTVWVMDCIRDSCLEVIPDHGQNSIQNEAETCVELGRCIKFDEIVHINLTSDLSDDYIKSHIIEVPMGQRKIYINNSTDTPQNVSFKGEKNIMKLVKGRRPPGLENVPIQRSVFSMSLATSFGKNNTLSSKLPQSDIIQAIFTLYSSPKNTLVNRADKENFAYKGSVSVSPCFKLEGNSFVSWAKNLEIDYDVYFRVSSVHSIPSRQLAEAVVRNWKHFFYVGEGLFKTQGKLYVTSGIETCARVSRDPIPHCVAHAHGRTSNSTRHKRETDPMDLCRCLRCLP